MLLLRKRYPRSQQAESPLIPPSQLPGPLLKVNLSRSLTGQNVGVKQITDDIWLVSFMHYDLGFFDHESCRLECAENPFAAKLSPMSSV